MNLYIESFEGGVYLAAIGDAEKRYLVRNNDQDPMAFYCLNELKDHFRGRSFDKVMLKQSTPYDEMCGMQPEPDDCLEMEISW